MFDIQLSGLKYAHTGIAAYVIASLLLLVVTLLIAPFRAFIDLSNVALLYVLAVVLAGTRYGRSSAIFAAVLGSLLFAYVFVPPHFSLAITDIQYLLSALIMLGVALLVGHLTADLRAHAPLDALALVGRAVPPAAQHQVDQVADDHRNHRGEDQRADQGGSVHGASTSRRRACPSRAVSNEVSA